MKNGSEFDVGVPWVPRVGDPFSFGDSVFNAWADSRIIQGFRGLSTGDEAEGDIKPQSDRRRPLLDSLGIWFKDHIPHLPHFPHA